MKVLIDIKILPSIPLKFVCCSKTFSDINLSAGRYGNIRVSDKNVAIQFTSVLMCKLVIELFLNVDFVYTFMYGTCIRDVVCTKVNQIL